jgi:hypothetical protein
MLATGFGCLTNRSPTNFWLSPRKKAVVTVRREAQDKTTFARDSSFTSNEVNAGDL